jgi:hypothetical protein
MIIRAPMLKLVMVFPAFAFAALGVVAGGPPTSPPPRPAAPPATGPAGPFTMPSARTQPSRETFYSWQTPALFRLEATRCAAAEAPLPADLKGRLAARIGKARRDVDGISARYAAGEFRTSVARKTVDALMAQLKADLAATLGGRSEAFSARVDKTMGDVQLFSGSDPADGQLFMESSVKLNDTQKARINALLEDAAKQVHEIDKSDLAHAPAARHALGFATRAAIRALLTAEQLKAFDGPFEAPAVSLVASAPTTGPTTAEARPGLSEAQAIALTRLEALGYAVLEGPYSPQDKAAVAEQIGAGTVRVKDAPSTAPAAAFGADDERVGRIYASVLAEASKILRDQAADLIHRQGRIYQDVTAISTGQPWHGRTGLERLTLSESQEAQIDRILADCAIQLAALNAKPGRSRLSIDSDPAAATRPYAGFFASDPTLGPAARSLRRRKVAFETRAAVRDVLTPQQQADWDAMGE